MPPHICKADCSAILRRRFTLQWMVHYHCELYRFSIALVPSKLRELACSLWTAHFRHSVAGLKQMCKPYKGSPSTGLATSICAGSQGVVGSFGCCGQGGCSGREGRSPGGASSSGRHTCCRSKSARALRLLRGLPCDTGRRTPLPCEPCCRRCRGRPLRGAGLKQSCTTPTLRSQRKGKGTVTLEQDVANIQAQAMHTAL